MRKTKPTLHASWNKTPTLLNLRCQIDTPGLAETMTGLLGLALPVKFNTTLSNEHLRIVWIGPDEWLLHSTKEQAHLIETRLREGLPDQHIAVTDVSSNYHILKLSGAPVRDVLAQGCPLDLHPRVFKPGDCAGSHYFKAAIWLWHAQTGDYELLIRRSFAGYVQLMIERASAECALVTGDN